MGKNKSLSRAKKGKLTQSEKTAWEGGRWRGSKAKEPVCFAHVIPLLLLKKKEVRIKASGGEDAKKPGGRGGEGRRFGLGIRDSTKGGGGKIPVRRRSAL